MPRKYLFVTGCPRSGTTALVNLLASHYAIVIGRERYKYVVREMRRRRVPGLIDPSSFEPERFFDFRDTDTNIRPPAYAGHYEAARQRLDQGLAEWVGDKVMPPDEWVLLELAERFEGARFVFIYRDLLAVASSFEVRARDVADTDWPPENDHRAAYRQWIESFAAAERLLEVVGPERLMPLKYERLFDGPAAYEALFSFLGLEPWDGTRQAFADLGAGLGRKAVAPSSGPTEGRPSATVLTPDQQAMLLALDQGAVDRWDERFESSVRRWQGSSRD